jgi:ABC-type multidrug transport system ATPase subunit
VESHFPHLTVGQTLNFAVDTRTPAAQRVRSLKGIVNDQETQILATTFGLQHTLKTLVGNDFVRGVSGGERKRVSLAEVV